LNAKSASPQQLRKLGDVGGDPPGLVTGGQLTAVSAQTFLNSFGRFASGTSMVNRHMPQRRRAWCAEAKSNRVSDIYVILCHFCT
jgi:hypothetical protein